MPLGAAQSVAMRGLQAVPVTVEAAMGRGLPTTQLVGKADIAVRESIQRIRAAFSSSKLGWPRARMTLSLSPADVPKTGAHYDLAIAVAVLEAQSLTGDHVVASSDTAFLGELGLDGRIVPITGVLPMVLALRNKGIRRVYVPAANYLEATVVPDVEVVPLRCMRELVEAKPLPDFDINSAVGGESFTSNAHPLQRSSSLDFSDVRGQRKAVEGALVAAAGGHHILMLGPPGSGKSMIAARIPTILPKLNFEQSLEVTSVHSILGEIDPSEPLITEPAFVAPHPGVTAAALIGGGAGLARPGAISKAHQGVLFLDECTEMKTALLDLLRTPLQDGEIRLSRSQGTVTYPARFQLILAGNACLCGAASVAECQCSSSVRERYRRRLSGPLLDRIDIRMRLEPPRMELLSDTYTPTSEQLRNKVEGARQRAQERWGKPTPNAAVDEKTLSSIPIAPCALQPVYPSLRDGSLSARGLQRTIRLAWTIADLKELDRPGSEEIAEALRFRIRLHDL